MQTVLGDFFVLEAVTDVVNALHRGGIVILRGSQEYVAAMNASVATHAWKNDGSDAGGMELF